MPTDSFPHRYERPGRTGDCEPVRYPFLAATKRQLGARVLADGSNVHYLLAKALEKAQVDYRDVTAIFLPPADARAAFERGSVDAWVIWDRSFFIVKHLIR